MLCNFLSGSINHSGATDPNHNTKSWRYQIIADGGTVGCTLDQYMVDAYLLRLVGISMELIRSNDFASDLLPLKIFSTDTIQKLMEVEDDLGSTSSGDKGVVAGKMFIICLNLHAINDKAIPARHCVVYVWSLML